MHDRPQDDAVAIADAGMPGAADVIVILVMGYLLRTKLMSFAGRKAPSLQAARLLG